MTASKLQSPGTDSYVQNMLTDCLDLLLEKKWTAVNLTSGNIPVFRKDGLLFAAPEFSDPVDEQDLVDYLEALGMTFLTYRKSLPYMYRSDRFDGFLFSLDFFPASRNSETMVEFTWMGF